jgi:tetratricopeptide (TPR) repeat protein
MKIYLLDIDESVTLQICSILKNVTKISSLSEETPKNSLIIVPAFGKHSITSDYYFKNKVFELNDFRPFLFLTNYLEYEIFNEGFNCFSLEYPFHNSDFLNIISNMKIDKITDLYKYKNNKEEEEDSFDSRTNYHLSQFYLKTNIKKTHKHLLCSLKQNPKMIGNRLLLSNLLKTTRKEETCKILQKIKNDHFNVIHKINQIHLFHSDILLEEGKLEEAKTVLSHAKKSEEVEFKCKVINAIQQGSPTCGETLDKKIGLYIAEMAKKSFNLGDFPNSINLYKKSLELIGFCSCGDNVRFNLVICLIKNKQLKEAQKLYFEYKDVLPEQMYIELKKEIVKMLESNNKEKGNL